MFFFRENWNRKPPYRLRLGEVFGHAVPDPEAEKTVKHGYNTKQNEDIEDILGIREDIVILCNIYIYMYKMFIREKWSIGFGSIEK